MNKEDVNKLIKLREFMITEYKTLDGASSPQTAVMKQEDAAHVYESVIRSLEDLLSDEVDFAN